MNFNRNEHSRFVQRLDKIAENNPILWLPCVVLIFIAIGAEKVSGWGKSVFPHNEQVSVKGSAAYSKKPFVLRVVAMGLVMAFGFMAVPEFNEIISANVYADDISDFTLGYNENSFPDEPICLNNIADSGVCGDNLTWTLSDDGILSISGTGKIETLYGSRNSHISNYHSPWYDINKKIKQVVISDGVSEIEESAFHECATTSIIIPDSVKVIEDHVFCNCTNLADISLPVNLTSLGEYSFNMCTSLEKIAIPNTITSIESYTFLDCYKLSKIKIPSSVTYISSNAFEDCSNLTIYCDAGSYVETYAKENGIPFKDISEFDGSDNHPSKLTAIYINSPANIPADINKINLYEQSCIFDIPAPDSILISESMSAVGTAYIRKYDNNEIVFAAREDADLWCDDNKINICVNSHYQYFDTNTKYYIDLSDVTINGQLCPSNDNCKKQYTFRTGFAIKHNQVFSFKNIKNSFVGIGEKDKYHITDQFYNKEIRGLKKVEHFMASIVNHKWDGSCFGMSSTMILINQNKIDKMFETENQVIQNANVFDYAEPTLTKDVPYGTRDIINYFQLFQYFIEREKMPTDIDTIDFILYKAKNIENVNDIFNIAFSYKKENSFFYVGHSVTVIGVKEGDENTLLVYDPSSENYNPSISNNTNHISEYRIDVENNKIYLTQTDTVDKKTKQISNIGYYLASFLNDATPSKIKNKTRINVNIKESVNQIFNVINSVGNLSSFFYDSTYQGSLVPNDVYYLANGQDPSDMMIVLPPETYYEINSDNGSLSYDIVNDDMFFAAKADNVEKSIVSAEDGIKLTNAVGSFELTVSADESMPYDMFDISGTANGDVDCQYTGNTVTVNLNNTSDTTITFYRDLEEETHIVPAEYDEFIIGENNNEEAILVDTDGDGNFETDILNDNIHTHIPSAEYSSDETGHWHNCTQCGEKIDFAAHTEGSGVITVEPTETAEGEMTYSCTVCGYVTRRESIPANHTHISSAEYSSDETGHWYSCTLCGGKIDFAAHSEDSGTVILEPTENATGLRVYRCTVCGYERTETIPIISEDHTHTFGTSWTYDSTYHWHECSCGERTNTDRHTDNGGIVTVQPTSSTAGTKVHSCMVCGCVIYTETIPALGIIDRPDNPDLPPDVLPMPIFPSDRNNILNKEIELSVRSELTGLSSEGAHIESIRKFFSESATIRLTETADSKRAAELAMNNFDNEKMICYPFDISVYSTATGEKIQLRHSGYITFEIPVPESMVNISDSIAVYHIAGGTPEHIESEIITDTKGNKKIKFTAKKFSPYMFTAETAEDITAEAAANSTSSDFTGPVSNGVTVPAMKLPRIVKWTGKKKRFIVIKKRRINDILFAF